MSYTSIVHPHSKGFTLIEIVFALTIFSIMLITAYSGIIGILKVKKMLDDERELQQTAMSVMDRLSHEIELANGTGSPLLPPCDNQNKNYGRNLFFLAERSNFRWQRLSFIAPGIGQMLPEGMQNTGNVQVSYHMEREERGENNYAEDTFALVRDEIPLIKPVDKSCKKMIRFTIASGIKNFSLRFYDQTAEQWVKLWDENAKGLPKMVLVELELITREGKIGSYSMIVGLHGGK